MGVRTCLMVWVGSQDDHQRMETTMGDIRKTASRFLVSLMILSGPLACSLTEAGATGLVISVLPADTKRAFAQDAAARVTGKDQGTDPIQLSWLAGSWETTDGQSK